MNTTTTFGLQTQPWVIGHRSWAMFLRAELWLGCLTRYSTRGDLEAGSSDGLQLKHPLFSLDQHWLVCTSPNTHIHTHTHTHVQKHATESCSTSQSTPPPTPSFLAPSPVKGVCLWVECGFSCSSSRCAGPGSYPLCFSPPFRLALYSCFPSTLPFQSHSLHTSLTSSLGRFAPHRCAGWGEERGLPSAP